MPTISPSTGAPQAPPGFVYIPSGNRFILISKKDFDARQFKGFSRSLNQQVKQGILVGILQAVVTKSGLPVPNDTQSISEDIRRGIAPPGESFDLVGVRDGVVTLRSVSQGFTLTGPISALSAEAQAAIAAAFPNRPELAPVAVLVAEVPPMWHRDP